MRAADRAGLGLAVLRLAIVPIVFAGERLVEHPPDLEQAFPPLLAMAGAWAVAILALRARAPRREPEWLRRAEPGIDLLWIGALTYTSGGALSQAATAFFVLPIVAALQARPRVTAGWVGLTVAVFLAVSLPHPALGAAGAKETAITHALYLAWTGAGAVLVSAVIAARTRRIEHLAAERGRLVAQALEAEERERRRLAEILHDDAVQTLSLARQELTDFGRHGHPESYERAQEALKATLAQLRGEIAELHPYILDHAGLAATLQAIAEQQGRRAQAAIEVAVDPQAEGRHDRVLVALARELLANAAQHARAERIDLAVRAHDGTIALRVADDGCGFGPERPAAALAEGHIGLASTAERVRALGGRLSLDSAPGRGTRVEVVLPA